MTPEEIEDVMQALARVMEILEPGVARLSIQEAFMQVRAYAGATGICQGEAAASTTAWSLCSDPIIVFAATDDQMLEAAGHCPNDGAVARHLQTWSGAPLVRRGMIFQ